MQLTDFKQIEITPKERKFLAPHMHSWRSIYPLSAELEDTQKSLGILEKMLAYEVQVTEGGARKQVLTRLHMRLNAMRNRMEFVKLEKHAVR